MQTFYESNSVAIIYSSFLNKIRAKWGLYLNTYKRKRAVCLNLEEKKRIVFLLDENLRYDFTIKSNKKVEIHIILPAILSLGELVRKKLFKKIRDLFRNLNAEIN